MATIPHYRLFIDGEFREGSSGSRMEAVNPYDGKVWATVAAADVSDVTAAVSAARTAYRKTWSRYPGYQRAGLMHRLADLLESRAGEMGMLESTDNGKIIRETQSQMVFASRQYRFFAGYADKLWGQQIPLDAPDVLDYTTRVPYGVVGLITAWNSPISLLANKLAPALAAGNCVVIKPSEHASASTLEFCRIVLEAGFPPGVVNVVCGAGDIGSALVGSDVGKISFTGSPEIGSLIAQQCGRRLIPVTLELGGKSPNIIFGDANLEKACIGAIAGIFGASGQTCIAGSRLLVQRPVVEQVLGVLAERTSRISLGNPLEPTTDMGPVANRPQFDRVNRHIARAIGDGARLVAGGAAAEPAAGQGYFIPPTIFADVEPGMDLAREEIFGPVLAVIPFDSEAQAIEIANDTPFGLAGGVWTEDLSRALRVSRALDVGQVWVNTYRALAVQAPFGGTKQSGFGRERGEAALNEYLTIKNTYIDYSADQRDPFSMRT